MRALVGVGGTGSEGVGVFVGRAGVGELVGVEDGVDAGSVLVVSMVGDTDR